MLSPPLMILTPEAVLMTQVRGLGLAGPGARAPREQRSGLSPHANPQVEGRKIVRIQLPEDGE